MLPKIMSLFVILFVLIGCEQNVKVSDKPLTAADSLNLKLVTQAQVASFGAPPMIPQDHPVVIGEDINPSQNGGESCLECHHNSDMADDVTQTKHPERNNCLQCHIPVKEETATANDFQVDNTFQKYEPK